MLLRGSGPRRTNDINLIILPRPRVLVYVDQGGVGRGEDWVGRVPVDVDRIPSQTRLHKQQQQQQQHVHILHNSFRKPQSSHKST